MSRQQHWIGIGHAGITSPSELLASSTSHNQIHKITIEHPTRSGIYYQKHYPHPSTAKFEATVLAMTGVPLDNIFIQKDIKTGNCSLFTKDNGFHSIYTFFSQSLNQDLDEALGKSPPQSLNDSAIHTPQKILEHLTDQHIDSLTKILIDTLLFEDDNCHASNLGLTPDFTAFTRIDWNAIRYLVNHDHRSPRLLDSSTADCFDLTSEHINRLFTPSDYSFPHYHPLHVSGYLTSEQNSYTPLMVLFFSEKLLKIPASNHF